jgi:hypothetical protein
LKAVTSRQESIHPLAPDQLPGFIPAADGSDPLFTFVVILLVALFLAVGILYLKLHSLPERLGHKQNNTQLQLIAVLAVLALFTHNNVFWVLALLLAVVRLPDFTTPLNSIAESLKAMSPGGNEQAADEATAEAQPQARESD